MKRLILTLAVLLIALPAWGVGVKRVGSTPHVFTLSGVVSDGATTTTAANPDVISPCYATNLTTATFNAAVVCIVPPGRTWTIREVAYYIYAATSAAELCNFGLSTDITGAAALGWSDTDMGTATTPTCDNTVGFTGALDAAGEFCVNSDPVGLTATTGTVVYLMVSEVSADSCDSVVTIAYSFKVEETVVATP